MMTKTNSLMLPTTECVANSIRPTHGDGKLSSCTIKKRRSQISDAQRVALCKQSEATPRPTQRELASWFSHTFEVIIDQSTISKTLKRKAEILNEYDDSGNRISCTNLTKHHKGISTCPIIDRSLAEWLLMNENQMPITGEIIKEKGRQFFKRLYPNETRGSYLFSTEWLNAFKKRYNIKLKDYKVQGDGAVLDVSSILASQPELRDLLSQFQWEDIFYMDETSLFYRMEPDYALTAKQLAGANKYKERLTVVVCSNAIGTEKIPCWLIGSFPNPQCFKNVNMKSLGIVYRSNSHSSMTAELFQHWLLWFDQQMQGRRVLLVIDNCPSHIVNGLELHNVTVKFVPLNAAATSRVHPFSIGIILMLKACYRRRFISLLYQEMLNGVKHVERFDILQAAQLLVATWYYDLRPEIIHNLFVHNLLQGSTEQSTSLLEINNWSNGECNLLVNGKYVGEMAREIQEKMTALQYNNPMSIHSFLNPEEETTSVDIPADACMLEKYLEDNSVHLYETDDTLVRPEVSHGQALAALDVLELYWMQQEKIDTNDSFGGELDLMRNKIQQIMRSGLKQKTYFQ